MKKILIIGLLVFATQLHAMENKKNLQKENPALVKPCIAMQISNLNTKTDECIKKLENLETRVADLETKFRGIIVYLKNNMNQNSDNTDDKK